MGDYNGNIGKSRDGEGLSESVPSEPGHGESPADGAEKSIAPELPVESGKRVEPAGCARERAGA